VASVGKDQRLRGNGLGRQAKAWNRREERHTVMDARYPEVKFGEGGASRLIKD
jgi:hypothetical protein